MTYRIINPRLCVHGIVKRGKKAPRRNVRSLNRRLVTVEKFDAPSMRTLGLDGLGLPQRETIQKERQYHFTKGNRVRTA